MKKKNKQKLSDHIREVLSGQEEPYDPGSWEQFQRYKNRNSTVRNRRIIFGIAASILLVLISQFAWNNYERSVSDPYVEVPAIEGPDLVENETTTPLSENEKTNIIEEDNDRIDRKDEEQVTPQRANNQEEPKNIFDDEAPAVSRKSIARQFLTQIYSTDPSDTTQYYDRDMFITRYEKMFPIVGERSESQDPSLTNSSIQREARIQNTAWRASKREFVFSVGYAPVMNIHDSQTDIGVGGGFYTDWNLTENISVVSGLFVSQNNLKYENKQASLMEETEVTTMSGGLSQMQVDLLSLEVPLSLRYFITDWLSISAGLSSVAFLKEHFNYTFEYQEQVQVFEENETTTEREPVGHKLVTKTDSYKLSEPSLNGMNWGAFYTVSVSYQREIMKRHMISFEPFLKIPARNVTSRDITYTTGGLQLKVSF